jgi:hypothetical protein
MKLTSLSIKRDTERAYQVEGSEGTFWIPKSVITTVHRKPDHSVDMEVEDWWYDRHVNTETE